MDIVEVQQSGLPDAGRERSPRIRWKGPAVVGAAAFWLANLAISLTPVAADYRSALSIPYLPMLGEAAAGGLVIGNAVALTLARFPDHVPGRGPLRKALLLAAGALVLFTVLLEMPSKLRSGIPDPGHWLLVATVFNVIRILALGAAIGLVVRAREGRHHGEHRPKGEQAP